MFDHHYRKIKNLQRKKGEGISRRFACVVLYPSFTAKTRISEKDDFYSTTDKMKGLRGSFLHFHTFISSILWYWKYWSETNLWFMNKLTIYKTTGENMVPESKDQMEKGAILIMTIAALQSIFNWHCWQSFENNGQYINHMRMRVMTMKMTMWRWRTSQTPRQLELWKASWERHLLILLTLPLRWLMLFGDLIIDV